MPFYIGDLDREVNLPYSDSTLKIFCQDWAFGMESDKLGRPITLLSRGWREIKYYEIIRINKKFIFLVRELIGSNGEFGGTAVLADSESGKSRGNCD